MTLEGDRLVLALDGRKMEGRIGDRPVDIIFDTGAPGAGLDREIVEARYLPSLEGRDGRTILPAFGISYKKRHAVLDTLTLGEATFQNIEVSVGYPTEEDEAILARQGVLSEMIFGLDLFRPHFESVVFYYDAGRVTFDKTAKQDVLSSAALTQDGKYIVDVDLAGIPAKMLIDTGSNSNTVSKAYAGNAPCFGYRRSKRSSGKFQNISCRFP